MPPLKSILAAVSTKSLSHASPTKRPEVGKTGWKPVRAGFAIALASLAGATLTGCAGMISQSLQPPGTWQQQRSRALFFDPFPATGAGPEMVGVRPREYSKPLPEAEQNQAVPRNMLPN